MKENKNSVKNKKAVVPKKEAGKPAIQREYRTKIFRSAVLEKDRNRVLIEARSFDMNGITDYELSIKPVNGSRTTFTNFKNENALIDKYNSEVKKLEKSGYHVVEEKAFDEREESVSYGEDLEGTKYDEPDIFDIPV